MRADGGPGGNEDVLPSSAALAGRFSSIVAMAIRTSSTRPSMEIIIYRGLISAQSGLIGDGGTFEASAGRNFTLTASVNLNGKDSGGDFTVDAGGVRRSQRPRPSDGHVDDRRRRVHRRRLGLGARRSRRSAVGQEGHSRVRRDNEWRRPEHHTRGMPAHREQHRRYRWPCRYEPAAGNMPGGSDIELVSKGLMTLNSPSMYLADPAGSIVTTHPPPPPTNPVFVRAQPASLQPCAHR